ncbi:hypothetical protein D0962_28520 [Leptolyngbyaceae cyanobacterium CCMR0082]|uniref:Uncharacterized protein n=1 Tax=Adonisia turfae CCMR0082 TaxID=2304604 RepID=A0A6M0SDV3_9CYAN|nr:hypothetical protein [Adonisia turfae]NEZ66658.1 hypothetical protein [Adonisia turfae CCMR0082]
MMSISDRYSDLSVALERVQDLTQTNDTGRESEILAKLDDTAARRGDDVRYRLHYVAALVERQNYDNQTLERADGGIRFTGNRVQIKSFLREQAALDLRWLADGFEIPPGYSAADELRDLLLEQGIDPDDAAPPVMSIFTG